MAEWGKGGGGGGAAGRSWGGVAYVWSDGAMIAIAAMGRSAPPQQCSQASVCLWPAVEGQRVVAGLRGAGPC